MDRLNGMTIFAEVARRGGFTPAARHLGLSRAQVSKAVSGLEEHLGARLLNRTTRRVSLTATGIACSPRCGVRWSGPAPLPCVRSGCAGSNCQAGQPPGARWQVECAFSDLRPMRGTE